MGLYDSVMANCPKCGQEFEFQSKKQRLKKHTEKTSPMEHKYLSVGCPCGTSFQVDVQTRKTVVVSPIS